MKTLRRNILKSSVLAGVLASSLVVAMPGGAVTGGTAVAPAPSWSVFISVHQKHVEFGCSGALVSSNYVLTSAQCAAPTSRSTCTFGKPFRPGSFTVYLDRTGGPDKGNVTKVTSVSVNANSGTAVDGQCVWQNDVALLQLKTSTADTPLLLAPSQSAVTQGASATLYGYGRTIRKSAKSVGRIHSTNSGDWTIDTGCNLVAVIGATCVDPQTSHGSSPYLGDTGAPWTITVDGTPVEALVHSGIDVLHGYAYGTGVAQPLTSAWLHSQLGIPTVTPGNIVRDPVSGNSWFIDPQGYRLAIPDATTFACLTGKGASVTDSDAASIALMAARTASATCTSDANVGVLIAGTGDGGWTAPNDELSSLLKSAGYQVTKSPSLPSDLSGYSEVWWVDTNPPTLAQQAQLVAFEQAGGGLFLTGDGACCETLSTALTSMINSMVVGGGITAGGQGNLCTCTTNMPVNPTVVGNLATAPFALTDWTVSQPGGLTGVPASNVFSYYQPGDITTRKTIAAAWSGSSLVGNGHLVVFMDINWTEQGYRAANWSSVAQNAALFLSGSSLPPGPVVP